VAALQARLKALEAENRSLKKQKKGGKAGAAAGGGGGGDAGEGEGGGGGGMEEEESEEKRAAREAKRAKAEQRREARKARVKEKRAAAREARKAERREKAAAGGGPGAGAGGGGKAGLEALRTQALAAAAAADMSAWLPLCLHPLLEGALALAGFAAPTPVQAATVPLVVRDRRDVIGAAQTGSGKTLAFGLPVLQLLLQEREAAEASAAAAARDGGADAPAAPAAAGKLRALVLAPTRELALQVCSHLQALARVAGVGVAPIVGGIAPVKQERLLSKRPEVVVATPGRLWDLMRCAGLGWAGWGRRRHPHSTPAGHRPLRPAGLPATRLTLLCLDRPPSQHGARPPDAPRRAELPGHRRGRPHGAAGAAPGVSGGCP
jgi:ATP-dependent RNA helicase DDX24/MAK5